MSQQGPSLRRHRDGGAVAKVSGSVLRSGRFDDPEPHPRFAALDSAWLRAGVCSPTKSSQRAARAPCVVVAAAAPS